MKMSDEEKPKKSKKGAGATSPRRSKQKGNGFENEVAKKLRSHLIPAVVPTKTAYNLIHRTGMSGGRTERADIVIHPPVVNHFPWFIECKNREIWDWQEVLKTPKRNSVVKWFRESAEKCHPYEGHIDYPRRPLLIFTKNFHPWYAMMWHDPSLGMEVSEVRWYTEMDIGDGRVGILLFEDLLQQFPEVHSELFKDLIFK